MAPGESPASDPEKNSSPDSGEAPRESSVPAGDASTDTAVALEPYDWLREFFPLFHELTKGDAGDFVLRCGLINELVAHPEDFWDHELLNREFSWLGPEKRNYVLRGLKDAGWLGLDPDRGYYITETGLVARQLLLFLQDQDARIDALGIPLMALEYYVSMGRSPLPVLAGMRQRLRQLVTRARDAIASGSPIAVLRARDYLERSLASSERVRGMLQRCDYGDREVLSEVNEIHRMLSRLHDYRSEMQRTLTAMGRQLLTLESGVTEAQLLEELLGRSTEELASLARSAFVPPLPGLCFILPDNAVAVAEQVLSRHFEDGEPVEAWESATHLPATYQAPRENKLLEDFVAELERIALSHRAVSLSRLVPREGRLTSLYRHHALSLVGLTGRPPVRRESPVGRLVRLPLDIRSTVEMEEIGAFGIERMSRGQVVPEGSEGKEGERG